MQIKDIINKVKQIEIRTRKKTEATLIGQYHSAFKGQGMIFSEVRPYQFGDEIRRIDWSKTARFREPFVKVMEEERELIVMFLVDISASMDYGTKVQLKKEYIAEIVASLGFSADSNNKVGLILFADKIYKVISPQKGRRHILSIINNILCTDYVSAESRIDKALEHMMGIFRRKSLVFLFSDFEDPYDSKILRAASKKHQLLGLRVYDEKDNAIPDVGYALFHDVETGKEIWANTSSARWRYNFVEGQKQKLRALEEDFVASSAGFINIITGSDYSKLLHNYFQRNNIGMIRNKKT